MDHAGLCDSTGQSWLDCLRFGDVEVIASSEKKCDLQHMREPRQVVCPSKSGGLPMGGCLLRRVYSFSQTWTLESPPKVAEDVSPHAVLPRSPSKITADSCWSIRNVTKSY